MLRITLIAVLGVFVLAACAGAGTNNSSQADNGTLATVPAEYAGKINPLGIDAAGEGEKVYQSTC